MSRSSGRMVDLYVMSFVLWSVGWPERRLGWRIPVVVGAGVAWAGQCLRHGRHRTKITRGPGSLAAGLAMAFNLI